MLSALPFLVLFGLLATVLLSIEIGYRLGIWRRSRIPPGTPIVSPSVEAAVFALMGLLIAFTFYGAGSRFDARRSLIAREANAISTTYLRLDLLPPQTQPELRHVFRSYVRSRLDVYRNVPSAEALKAAVDRSWVMERAVWSKSVEAVEGSGPAEKSLFLGSLNEMIDITTEQAVALATHPPPAVFAMLALTVLVSSALVGYTTAVATVRDWVSTILFALMVTTAVYVIVDYEFPRAGFIRIDPVDQVLVETLEQMK